MNKTKTIQTAFKVISFAVAVIFIAQWLWVRSYTVSINDARIASHVTSISSNSSGWSVQAPTQRGVQVKKDDILLKIDDREHQLKRQALDLEIAIKKTEIESAQTEQLMTTEVYKSIYLAQEANVVAAKAHNEKARSSLLQSKSDFARANNLLKQQLISTELWEQKKYSVEKDQQSHQQTQAELSNEQFQLKQIVASGKLADIQSMKIIMLKQSLQALQIARKQQTLAIKNRQIRSPINGIVDKVFVNHGEYISPGRRILMLHNPNDIWIDANVIETAIHQVKIGMKAQVTIDAFPDQTFTATVENIDHATTSEYALLPNPNPSGNFTKVTQRMRVRLAIKQQDNLLKPGMMVEVTIDTRG